MLKELRKFWKDSSIMSEVIKELGEMVRNAGFVYRNAWGVCAGAAIADKIKKSLKQHDTDVNNSEREIRKMLVEHLTINPGQDASGALAVMSMAKDIERIGDYSRNIFGISSRLEKPVTEYGLFSDFNSVNDQLEAYFFKLERSILDSNEALAHEILEDYQDSKGKLKNLQKKLFQTEMTGHEAVASALLTQCLVRINAHIGNAASGLVFPLHNIDFVSRGLREEE